MERAWAQTAGYLGDNEGDFLNRFRGAKFHGAAWELYLRATLIRAGLDLEKTSAVGPDICARVDGRRVWIEATTVEPGDPTKADSVRGRVDGQTSGVLFPVEQLLLRLTSSIDSKLRQVRTWIERGVVPSDEPVVLAINYGTILDADLHDVQVPAMVQAVFAVGTPVWLVTVADGSSSAPPIETVVPPRHSVSKSGVDIRTDVFRRPESAALTGILYARQLVWNLHWDAQLDLGYVHNPMANAGLPRSWLPLRSESRLDGDVVHTDMRSTRSEGTWSPRPLTRPSASAAASRRAERERLSRMSPRERALLALRLGAGQR